MPDWYGSFYDCPNVPLYRTVSVEPRRWRETIDITVSMVFLLIALITSDILVAMDFSRIDLILCRPTLVVRTGPKSGCSLRQRSYVIAINRLIIFLLLPR